MEHYLTSDGVSIHANIVYLKINDGLIIGTFSGYEGHGDYADSLFSLEKNKLKLSLNVYDFPKKLYLKIKKIEKFRTSFESKKELGSLSTVGKKLKNSDDTQQFDTHWEYGTEEFDLKILKKLSKKWSLSIKW